MARKFLSRYIAFYNRIPIESLQISGFLMHCPLYDVLRGDLFDQLSDVPGLDIASISNIDDDTLCHRLLFGDPSLGTIENRVILEATISFIKNSGRFD